VRISLPNPHPHGCFWHEMAAEYGAPDIKYCEETICSFISEPANTWSNLSFIIIGLYIAIRYRKAVLDMSPALKVYGVNMVSVGIGSLLYHLSNNFLTQFLDFLGMYAFAGLLMFYHFEQLKLHKSHHLIRNFIFSFIPFSILFFGLRYFHLPVQFSVILIALISLGTKVILVHKYRPNLKLFFYTLIPFTLAITAQLLDINRFMCNPQNHIFQFHGLWHIFNSIGMGMLFFYYVNFHKTVMNHNE
jgi:hypothetical protein